MNKKRKNVILTGIVILAAILLSGGWMLSNYIANNSVHTDSTPVKPDVVAIKDGKLQFSAGVNVNGLERDWSFNRGVRYLSKKSTYENIKSQGFDHIRIPIDFRLCYDEKTKTLNEKKMKKFDKIIDLAEASGLYAFIDFHGWYTIDSDDAQQKEMFLNIWELVAQRYKNRSELVAFELMNEPNIITMPPESLNSLQKETIEIIRRTNPTRLIICAAPDGNQPWLLGDLSLPEGDENLAVAVHIYNPGDFTHQGFEWAGKEKGVQVRLGKDMLESLKWDLNETKKFMDSTGIPVIINEFGLNLELADRKDISAYLRTITEFCKENGVPWTFWEYNEGDMGLYLNKKWDNDTLDDLFLR